MSTYTVGERVLVNSALEFATVTKVDGTHYTVTFPEGDTLRRSEHELTPAPQAPGTIEER